MCKTIKIFRYQKMLRWQIEIKQESSGKIYPVVSDNDFLRCDLPLRLSDGRILYDFPERIPSPIKSLVEKAFNWIDEQKNKEEEREIL